MSEARQSKFDGRAIEVSATFSGMTRYYFDAIDGVEAIDREGEELPDFEAAKQIAGQIAGEMTPARTKHIWAGGQFRVVIRTVDGVVGSMVVTAVGDGRATARWR